MMMCSLKRVSEPTFDCSYQASPKPCAARLVMTSFNPSPLTSYAYIWAPPRPNATGWCFHSGSPASEAGCSHQPSFSRRSNRPSPLTSPTPRPWVKRWYFLSGESGCQVNGAVGFLGSGDAYPYRPLLEQTISGRPSPVMSTQRGDSLSVTSSATWRFQWAVTPLPGFSNHQEFSPGKPRIRMSAQPSPLKSPECAKKLALYSFSLPRAPL